MSDVNAFIQPPNEEPPDVVAFGSWKCETCGMAFHPAQEGWTGWSITSRCHCGTKVEICPPVPVGDQ